MSSEANPEFLEKRPIPALLWEFSVPSIIATTVGATYNLFARIFVGQTIGTLGIAALHVSFPVMLLSLAFAMMIGTGASTLIAIRLGKKQNDKAEQILGQAILLYIILSGAFLLVGLLWLEPLLILFGATAEVLPLAKEYLSIIIWGTIVQEMSFGVNNFIRTEGKPTVAMISMILSAVLNIVFTWLFLYIFKTGIWGAAVANIIAMAVTSVWISWLYLSGRTVLRWRLKYFRFNLRLTWIISVFGAVPLVTQACSVLIQGVQNNLLARYGQAYGETIGLSGIGGANLAIGVMGTIFPVTMLIVMPILGLSQGMQPIVGYNVGANRPARVKRSLQLSLRAATAIGLVCWAAMMLRPEWFILPFVQKGSEGFQETLFLGCHAIRIYMFCVPLVGVNIISSAYFQAHGRPILSMMLTLFRQLFFLLPCFYLLPMLFEKTGKAVGLDGVWGAFPVSDFLAFIVALVFLIREYRIKNQAIQRTAYPK